MMTAPWEKYQATKAIEPTSGSSAPWEKYSAKESQPSQNSEPVSKKDSSLKSKAESGLEGFGEGATLGYLNNIQAALEKPAFAVMNALTDQNVEADDYLKARDYYNKRQENLQKENPKTFGTFQAIGTAASSLPVARAAQGATMLARAGQAAKAGAAYGALQNTSEKEGELTTLDHELAERTMNAGVGAGLGAASSLGADALVSGGSKVVNGLSSFKNKIGQSLKNTAEQLAENATGATGKQSEKFSKDAGRYLLDNKIVSFGDDVERIAEKSTAAIKRAEDGIDSSLKSLDENGIKVSQDKIVESIQARIKDLEKDSSKSEIVKNLKSIIDDIVNTGESELAPSFAENVKRGYNKNSKLFNNPKGSSGQEADKIAYRAYRDAVEEVADNSDKVVAEAFKQSKKDFGILSPIDQAAQRRAATLNQSPIGGLLDTAAVIGGAAGSDDPLTGGALGVASAVARRKLAPRAGSSLAVTFDKISKQLITNPEIAQLAKKSPDVFKSLVFGAIEKNQGVNASEAFLKAADSDEPKKGPEKWASMGAEKLQSIGVDQETIDKLNKTKKGRDILFQASDLKPGSKAFEKIVEKIRTGSTTNGVE